MLVFKCVKSCGSSGSGKGVVGGWKSLYHPKKALKDTLRLRLTEFYYDKQYEIDL